MAFKEIFRVKLFYFYVCVRDGVGDRVVGICSLHEQSRVRHRQLRKRSAVSVCVCVCVSLIVCVCESVSVCFSVCSCGLVSVDACEFV